MLVDAAKSGNFDAIVLPPHGGMLTESLTDPEGVLVGRLRAIVGPDVPTTAAFDLHAHVTESTLAVRAEPFARGCRDDVRRL